MLDQFDLTPLFEKFERMPAAQRAVLLSMIVLACVGLYWFMFYGGKRSELDVLQTKLGEMERDLTESRAVASNLNTFREELARLTEQLDEAVQRLPDSTELPVLLTDVTSLGKKSGLEFRSFRPRSEVNRGFYAEVPIDIELRGSYHNLGLFFDRIAHLPRIVRISELAMDVADDSQEAPVLKIKAVAETFRFIEGSKAKSGGK